jgi:parallel beta-helix repeat protein
MNKVQQVTGTKQRKPGIGNLLLIINFLMIVTFFSCKKQDRPLQQESASQDLTSTDVSNIKADIIVHAGSSIQAAVDAAQPGYIIKIEAGVYNEAVHVEKANIKIIGLSHTGSDVIIQNPGDEENGITVTDAGDGFLLRNVTVQNFEENGVYLDSVDGFSLIHVATISNGEYGLFPLHCSNGTISHCSATRHTDTGIYVGQSNNVTMESNTAFGNVIGMEAENSDDIEVTHNQSYDNCTGIMVDLLPQKDIKTSNNVHVSGNHVYNNNHINFGEEGSLESVVPVGIGILILGTDNTQVDNNNVTDNNFTGIVVFSTLVLGELAGLPPEYFADIEPNPDGAYIFKNQAKRNGSAPPPLPIELPGVDLLWDGAGINNCWADNIFKTSAPDPLPTCN